MKRFLLLLFSLLSLQSFAAENQVVQEVAIVESVVEEPAYNPQYRDVPPTFLGIPIDGPKSEFVAKLKQKGFVDSDHEGYLKGYFNRQKVELCVFANSNGGVFRVRVIYALVHSDYAFINIYNSLFKEVLKSSKYYRIGGDLLTKSDLDAIKNDAENVRDKGISSDFLSVFGFPNGKGIISIGLVFASGSEYFKYVEDDTYILYIDYENLLNHPDLNNPYNDL